MDLLLNLYISFPLKIRKSLKYDFFNFSKDYLSGLNIIEWIKMCGRTVPSFRPALEHEIESWKDFKRALRPEDRKRFDTLMNYARIHSDAGSMGARTMLSEILFISFALEQQKTIDLLLKKIKALEKKLNK